MAAREGAKTGAELNLPRLKFLQTRVASDPSRAVPPASARIPRPGPRPSWCDPEHSARPGPVRIPSSALRPPAGLPALAFPLQLPFPPSWLLAPRSLLLQINFVAEERGRGAGPRAQKKGWAPRAHKAGNR